MVEDMTVLGERDNTICKIRPLLFAFPAKGICHYRYNGINLIISNLQAVLIHSDLGKQ